MSPGLRRSEVTALVVPLDGSPFSRSEKGRDVETLALYDAVSAWSGLYRHLIRVPARLVVTGTHARTGIARAVHGSVAASIVRSSSPVLVAVRERAR